MIDEFLKTCKCVLAEECEDFKAVLQNLKGNKLFIGYMPSITIDLWPIHVLECTSANRFIDAKTDENIFIIPLGAHEFWAETEIKRYLEDFYLRDELPENDRNLYGASFEEMILLKSEKIKKTLTLDGIGCLNIIYARFTMSNGKIAHLLLVIETAHDCWQSIMEEYDISCDIIIDSHKGLGDWFEVVPLYQTYLTTKKNELLPKLYFKGKYISHEAPNGFELVYSISEGTATESQSEIYRTNW